MNNDDIKSIYLFSQQTEIQSSNLPGFIAGVNSKHDLTVQGLEQVDGKCAILSQANEANVFPPATITKKYGCNRWSRLDDVPAFSYSAAFNQPETAMSLPVMDNDTNAHEVTQRSVSLGVNTKIRQYKVILVRTMAAYSRHLITGVKQNEYQSGKQGRRPVFDTEWLAKSTSAHPTDKRSYRNNSLLLASGTEDLWSSSRRMSSPVVQDDSEFDFSSGTTTPNEGASRTT